MKENTMVRVKCTNKIRNNRGDILKYQLVTEYGDEFQATSTEIKNQMCKGQYEFINLQIDKAGRLIDKPIFMVAEKKEYDVIMDLIMNPKNKEDDLSYILQHKILKLSYECLQRQLEAIDDDEKLFLSNLNRLIHYTVSRLTIDGEEEIKLKNRILNILLANDIEPYLVTDTRNFLYTNKDEKELVKSCILYSCLLDYVNYIEFLKNKDCVDNLHKMANRLATDFSFMK